MLKVDLLLELHGLLVQDILHALLHLLGDLLQDFVLDLDSVVLVPS